MMEVSALSLARRYIGVAEIAGEEHHPLVLWWHSLCTMRATSDEVPWCSAFVNGIAWELELPRSESARARSWLRVGRRVRYIQAEPGFDVVVLKRGGGDQPGPDVIDAPGHVGFYAGTEAGRVLVLGGNQGDAVNVAPFDPRRILGVVRLHP